MRPVKYLSFLKILELLKAIRRTYHISKHNLFLGMVQFGRIVLDRLNRHPDEFFQAKRGITPIGTRASPAFCRDKGRMRRWVGALCLSW